MRPATDPRPRVTRTDADPRLLGQRCVGCGYRTAAPRPRCPECRSGLEDTSFGPGGVVWAATVVRIPVPGRTPPYTLAYVDLDGGPRVLAHVAGAAARPDVGARVRLVDARDGDVTVEVVA